jgi:hypothetical protein
LAFGACALAAATAAGQDRPGRNRSTFDDANSDAESYPFDSSYDADFGRNQSADRQPAGMDRSTSDRQMRARHLMGFRLRVTDEGDVFVTEVFRGSAADRAGLRPGDKILAMEGFEIGSRADVTHALRQHSPDKDVELIVARFGRTREIDVRLPGRWGDPAEAIAKGAEGVADAMSQAATDVGGGVRRFSQAMQHEVRRHSSGRPPASVRDRYDRFSDEPAGIETDVDDRIDFDGGQR